MMESSRSVLWISKEGCVDRLLTSAHFTMTKHGLTPSMLQNSLGSEPKIEFCKKIPVVSPILPTLVSNNFSAYLNTFGYQGLNSILFRCPFLGEECLQPSQKIGSFGGNLQRISDWSINRFWRVEVSLVASS